jgi:hypothetical protein
VEQRYTTISIWVVLNGCDGCWDAVFISLEINYPVTLLMAASPVT